VDCAQWDRAPHEIGISRQEVNGDLTAAVAADDDGGVALSASSGAAAASAGSLTAVVP